MANVRDHIRTDTTSGNTLKVLFGKIKNWLGRLKALAFKDKIKNADVDSAAAIEYAKLSGVAPLSHTHDDRYYTESEMDTKLNGKQDTLSWDSTPTANSAKPVTSGGIKTALDGKVTASGGEIGDTKVTFSDATGTRSNISSGDTTKNLFSKIKQWFAALGTLAFKSSITNSDVSSSAAIGKKKLDINTVYTHTFTIGKNTVQEFECSWIDTQADIALGSRTGWGQKTSGGVPVPVNFMFSRNYPDDGTRTVRVYFADGTLVKEISLTSGTHTATELL